MTRRYKPGEWHPSGFGGVPTALMVDKRTRMNHVAAYAAIVSTVDNATVVCEAYNRRLLERAGMSYHTLHEAIRDLEEWGYLERLPDRPPLNGEAWKANRWRILPTHKITRKLGAEEAADAATLDPVMTGRETGKEGKRSRGERDTPNPPRTTEGLAATATGVSRPPRDPPRPPRDSLDLSVDTDLDIVRAEAHERLRNATKVKSLVTRLGKDYALDALEEVDFQLNHPELREAPISDVFGYAGAIARCYKTKCDDAPDHGDIHGTSRREYHRGRRRDHAVAERAEEARHRAPSDPDAEYRELDAERERQKAELTRLQNDSPAC